MIAAILRIAMTSPNDAHVSSCLLPRLAFPLDASGRYRAA